MHAINTKNAPAAIGPYSQAIQTDEFVFLSGQIGLSPDTGALAVDLESQTKQIFANIRAILDEAGSSLSQVVKATVFLVDLKDFETVNAMYEKEFGDHKPARSTIQVAALPKGAKIEIEVIAKK